MILQSCKPTDTEQQLIFDKESGELSLKDEPTMCIEAPDDTDTALLIGCEDSMSTWKYDGASFSSDGRCLDRSGSERRIFCDKVHAAAACHSY